MGLIVALDSYERASDVVRATCGIVDGFKLGLPLLLEVGAERALELRRFCSGAFWVADLKLADIGHVMVAAASRLVGGVDAIIAHSFVGVAGALEDLKLFLESKSTKLILVVAMSHPGAAELYEKLLDQILDEVAPKVGPWGVVAPATRPELVRLTRRKLGPSVKILSPGVGAQGAQPGSALCAGADYEIVGRAITASEDPRRKAEAIRVAQGRALERCAGGA
ncbi:MAG: orotidine-5'-phosphate decarboxylase [Thermoproteota archaeon]